MRLPETLRYYLADELRRVADLIKSGADPVDKAYFLSGAYGSVQRVFNIDYREELLLLFVVVQNTHQQIASRLELMKRGEEPVVRVPPESWDVLSRTLTSIANRIAEEQGFVELLAPISAVGFACTGNGSYLYQTGRIHF